MSGSRDIKPIIFLSPRSMEIATNSFSIKTVLTLFVFQSRLFFMLNLNSCYFNIIHQSFLKDCFGLYILW